MQTPLLDQRLEAEQIELVALDVEPVALRVTSYPFGVDETAEA